MRKDPITTGSAWMSIAVLGIFVIGEILPIGIQWFTRMAFLFALGAFSIWNYKHTKSLHSAITGPGTLFCGILAAFHNKGIRLGWDLIWMCFIAIWVVAYVVEKIHFKKTGKTTYP